MSQLRTVNVKLESVMRAAAFVKGFKDAQAGKPIDYDAFVETRDTNKVWQYERGRQFGLIFSGKLKDGARITWSAKAAYREAVWARVVI
jgi:hypothetical protein